MTHRTSRLVVSIVAAVSLAGIVGCKPSAPAYLPPATRIANPNPIQATYNTPSEAAAALSSAARSGDPGAFHPIFGPTPRELLSGDAVEDADDFKKFTAAVQEGVDIQVAPGELSARVYVGKDHWPSPIPLVRRPGGRWFFDLDAAVDTVLARRIGSNELRTIDSCRAFVAAQREYASVDREGDGVLQYAQHFISTPGRHDGLYWPPANSSDVSPLGSAIAASAEEGYHPQAGVRSPYHGYYLHVLHAQGKNAPGGAYDYVINGRMIAGFAMVAYPARYGSSGIMTFIVSHQGRVYEKDLGPETEHLAPAISAYDPDASWKLVTN
jgi:predicted small lipoprotein YifL